MLALQHEQPPEGGFVSGPLGPGYASLTGQALLERLQEDGRADALEALWRLGNPQVQAEVVPYMVALAEPWLNDLLLDPLLDDGAVDPPAAAVLAAVDQHRPLLSEAGVDRLIDRLLDPKALAPPVEMSRARLEICALRQEAPRADRFARAVIAKETSQHADKYVRQEAVARCRKDPELRRGVYQLLIERLRTDISEDEWKNAASFIEDIAVEHPGEDGRTPLLEQMLTVLAKLEVPERNRSTGQRFSVPGTVKAGMQKNAFPRIRELLQDDRLDAAPPRLALAELALTTTNSTWRWAALKDLAVHQPDLWTAVWPSVAENWTDAEWLGAMKALAVVGSELDGAGLSKLIAKAPPACSALCMRLALVHSATGAETLTQAATQVLRTRITQDTTDNGGLTSGSRIFWWPKDPDEQQKPVLKALLSAVPDGEVPNLVVDALTHERVNPATAAFLLSPDAIEPGLGAAQGQDRERLARACYALDPAATVAAVNRLQSKSGDSISLELLAAIAEQVPDVAFSPVAGAWSALDDSDKDVVVDLLEAHATLAQSPLLEKIVGDTLHTNAERRRRAAVKLTDLIEPGGDVPQLIIGMLEAGNANTRQVGVDCIRRIRPRSLEAVRKLRDRASKKDASARAAKEVLKELAEDYIGEIAEDLESEEREARIELLGLVGETGQAVGVDMLLQHLGQEAIDDHGDVRLAAARALRLIAEHAEFDDDQQRAVGRLLDEEGGEDHPATREMLSAALTDLTLGPEKALKVLYELVDFQPKRDPDQLFGPEKHGLVRHLQLFDMERTRGDVARPQRLQQLDLISEKLLRAAYLRVGTSTPLREKILEGGKDPRIGELLQALETVSALQKSRAPLTTVHDLRSEKTEYTHPGETPCPEEETTALTCFKSGARRLLGVLQQQASEPWPN